MDKNPPPVPKTKYRHIDVTHKRVSFLDQMNQVRIIDKEKEDKERKEREAKQIQPKKGWCNIL